MNLSFQYMYRDAGNYKWYGEMIFPIHGNSDLPKWEAQIRSVLIDGLWFDPVKWNVPDIREEEWDEELDHGWFEFQELKMTEAPANTDRNFYDWLTTII